MNSNKSCSKEQSTKNQLSKLQREHKYSEIANLIEYSFQNNSKKSNQKIFSYIPRIFREVKIEKNLDKVNDADVFIGEPVRYKIYFPDGKEFCKIPYFYIFCYIKDKSSELDVYFQSALGKDKLRDQAQYDIEKTDITFEGLGFTFDGSNSSVISINDPGHFVPGLCSSFYIGTPEINFAEIIAKFIEKVAVITEIKLKKIMLFGSSAGSMGALMSSTYFSSKVNVMSVNSQITMQKNEELLNILLNINEEEAMNQRFKERISCTHRFETLSNITKAPNIYMLVNINDNLYNRNYRFHSFYNNKFIKKSVNNQFVFDSYYGIDGHGRPNKEALKAKIRFAREILSMEQN